MSRAAWVGVALAALALNARADADASGQIDFEVPLFFAEYRAEATTWVRGPHRHSLKAHCQAGKPVHDLLRGGEPWQCQATLSADGRAVGLRMQAPSGSLLAQVRAGGVRYSLFGLHPARRASWDRDRFGQGEAERLRRQAAALLGVEPLQSAPLNWDDGLQMRPHSGSAGVRFVMLPEPRKDTEEGWAQVSHLVFRIDRHSPWRYLGALPSPPQPLALDDSRWPMLLVDGACARICVSLWRSHPELKPIGAFGTP